MKWFGFLVIFVLKVQYINISDLHKSCNYVLLKFIVLMRVTLLIRSNNSKSFQTVPGYKTVIFRLSN